MEGKGVWKRSVLICVFALTFLLALIYLLITGTKADEETLDVADSPVSEIYVIGDTLVVPERTLAYNGNEYSADHYVQCPDKKTIGADTLTLDQGGEYRLVYFAWAEGVYLKESFDFYVAENLYEVTSMRSAVSYGESEAYPGVNGILVRLASGDSFRFNRAVDISEFGSADSIFSMILTPETIGIADAQEISVTLTDCYNSDNYIVITVKQNTASTTDTQYYTSYATANAGNIQVPTGMERHSSGEYLYNGDLYKIHKNNRYGAYFRFSMTGRFSSSDQMVGSEVLGFSLDPATKSAYVINGTSAPLFVSDLDDPQIYDTVWQGFSGGKVFVSVSAASYNATTASFAITAIGGKSVEEENIFVKNDPPIIQIDYEGYNDIPDAIAGADYPVFRATAFSAYDENPSLTQRVFYSYDSPSSRFEVDVADGRFQTKYEGTYSIVYTAKDRYGNEKVEEVRVNCVETDKKLAVTLNPETESGVAGMVVSVAEPEIISYYGDDYTLEISACLQDSDIRYEIGEDLQFIPQFSGTYEIRYFCQDISGRAEESYLIKISANEAPILPEINLPAYLIAGATYELPQISAVTYPEGVPEQTPLAEISITEVGGNRQDPVQTDGNIYTVGNCEYVEITYSVQTDGGYDSFSKRIKVIDTGYGESLDLAAYFYDADGAFENEKNLLYINYYTKQTTANEAELVFINRVSSKNFSFEFNGDPDRRTFEGIELILTSATSGNRSIRFTYLSAEASTEFYINGILAGSIRTDMFSTSERLRCSYDDGDLTVSVADDGVWDITDFVANFSGFNDMVYLTIRLIGIEGAAGLRVYRLCGQQFGSSEMDRIAPNINVTPISGIRAYGEILTLNGAEIYDVLDPFTQYNFEVRDPSGNIVRSTDGILLTGVDPSLNYTIQLNAFGNWLVTYTAQDAAGTIANYSYAINVPDTEPPVILLEGAVSEGSVHTAIRLPSVQVSDNITEEPVLIVILRDPDGRMQSINGDTFTVSREGKYTLYYYALDEEGNCSVSSYEILVKG